MSTRRSSRPSVPSNRIEVSNAASAGRNGLLQVFRVSVIEGYVSLESLKQFEWLGTSRRASGRASDVEHFNMSKHCQAFELERPLQRPMSIGCQSLKS